MTPAQFEALLARQVKEALADALFGTLSLIGLVLVVITIPIIMFLVQH